jgi:hypothetical protein
MVEDLRSVLQTTSELGDRYRTARDAAVDVAAD